MVHEIIINKFCAGQSLMPLSLYNGHNFVPQGWPLYRGSTVIIVCTVAYLLLHIITFFQMHLIDFTDPVTRTPKDEALTRLSQNQKGDTKDLSYVYV